VASENVDLSSLRIDDSKRDYPSDSRKSKKKYLWVIGLLALVLIVLIISGVFSSAVEVKLTTVTLQSPSQADVILTASGYVVAQRKAAVASKGTGRLAYLGVVEGDKVKKNQIIARLEDNDIRAQLDEAKANLKLQEAERNVAEKNYERQEAMLAAGANPQSDFDAAEANYNRVLASIELAKAQVDAAEVALENMLIRAPFDGTVLTKNADVGEIVAPLAAGANSRAAVVTIADMSSLQVEADVSESNIEKIQPDMDCEITLDAYPDNRYAGYVAKIVPTADRSKATVMVKVGFRNYDERVLPEMSAKVSFLSEKGEETLNEAPVLLIPQSALAKRDGKEVAFRFEKNKAVETVVTTGRTFGDYVEIKDGLANGDQVIDNVNDQIVNGAKVKIKS
jgi:RND family efflux transporter MFP subunit